MSEKFDPFYTWLGIPPEEQPANHYRLLGLKNFEPNLEVISNAADQRMAHLRTLQVGKNAALSQSVLNDVSAAAACLLNVGKKTAYDSNLRKQLEVKAVPKAKPLPQAAVLPAKAPLAAPLPPPPLSGPALPPQPLPPPNYVPVPAPIPQPAFAPAPAPFINKASRPVSKGPTTTHLILAGLIVGALLTSAVIVIAAMNGGDQLAANSGGENSASSNGAENSVVPPAVNPVEGATLPGPPPKTDSVTPAPPPLAPPTPETTSNSPTPSPDVPANSTVPPAVADPVNPPVTTPDATPSSPAIPDTRPPELNSDDTPAPNPVPFGAALDPPDGGDSPAPADAAATPLPSEDALTAARAQILEIFGKEAKAANKPELKYALARKMDKLARETKDDPAGCYVLLDNARKLFIGAGEVSPALRAVQNLTTSYRFEPKESRDLFAATYSALADATLAPEQRDSLADKLKIEIDTAVLTQQIEYADQLSLLGLKVTSRLKDLEKKRQASQQRTAVVKLKNEYAEYERALATLAGNPTDAAANLIAGKFVCTMQQDWKKGRAHLAAAGIESLQSVLPTDQVADGDNGEPDSADLQLAAAEAWFDWADNTKGVDLELIALAKIRAKYWYRQAVSALTGLSKAKAEKRIKELSAVPDTAAPRPASGSTASASKPGTSSTKSASNQTGWEPGLFGLVLVDNQVQNVLVSYQPGHTITGAEFDPLLQPFRQPTQRVMIRLEGVLIVPKDGDYTFHHVGGSSSGGVHTFFVRGEKISTVGDDRTKNEMRTISLPKGEHILKWELTGGGLGNAKIDVRCADGAPADALPPVMATPKRLTTTLRQQAKTEVAFGAAAKAAEPSSPAPAAPKFVPLQFDPPAAEPPVVAPSPQSFVPASSAEFVASEWLPGMRGLIYVDGAPQDILLSYVNENKVIESTEFNRQLSRFRAGGGKLSIVFEGVLVIAADGEYGVFHGGGTSSEDFNTVSLNGEKFNSVGAGIVIKGPREKIVKFAKGTYPIRWELTGGPFREARLDFRLPAGAPATQPMPQVFTSKVTVAELQKGTKSEVVMGEKTVPR
ncbi:hypothetical protein ETAA8_49180 [Anatilimnocola aggregata]|uniref:PA14 domain-containing protein n=1 Tax=Anatilimnocola aggregata TaxID=2528021 RepID=A0A517YHV0_9BACT|nr:hypothetical protein [Anatilimnocola aggregata]QDU29803.1 hypothetical protein ETAA8_49180 [Anatilimnocola aggregata]